MNEQNNLTLIRVVIALDQALVSAGTCALLEKVEGIEVIGQAATATELIENLSRWQPDVVLLDILLPGMFDRDLIWTIRQDFPQVRLVALKGSEPLRGERGRVFEETAVHISRNASLADLVLALRTVASGGSYSSPDTMAEPQGPEVKLTRRQTQVLRMMALGHTTKQIAQLLGISAKTVETHRAQMIDRLDIHNLAGLVRYAIDRGLIEND